MKFKVLFAVAACAALSGCAEFETGLMAYADQLDMENGAWWPDEHLTDVVTGVCPAYSEYGHVNNQTYYRVRNTGRTPMQATVTWNTGYESNFYLEPGETSDFVYMTPSVMPREIRTQC